MSEKYGEDQPWHLTQEPNAEPSYEELIDHIKELQAQRNFAQEQVVMAEAKLEKVVEALDGIMVGGNHLAVWLPDNHPPADVEPLVALEKIGAGVSYDVWCCWRSIMLARTTLAGIKGEK